MSQIEDRVAKAIANAWHQEDCWDALSEEAFDCFIKAAHAAIKVIQPPAAALGDGVIARAAKALEEADVNTDTFHYSYEYWPKQYEQIVRVVIEALREPTGSMIFAGNAAGFKATWRTVTTDVYTAMIDAALKSESRS